LVACVPSANLVSDVICDGTHWIVTDPVPVNLASPGPIGDSTANTIRGTIVTATDKFVGSGEGLTGTAEGLIAGFALEANQADMVPWGGVSDKPTTMGGYGITDGLSSHQFQNQTPTYFGSAAGTAPNFTATLTPAPSSLSAGLRVNGYFPVSTPGSAAPTLNLNGLGAKAVMQWAIPGGALLPASLLLYANYDLVYDGIRWILLNPTQQPVVSGGRFKNLQITYGQATGNCTITADEVTVSDAAGNQTRLTSVNVSASLATMGAIGGTDGGSIPAGNFAYLYVCYNPTTGGVGALISGAQPVPDHLLSGFTQWCRVGANKAKTTTAWLPGQQNNCDFSVQVGTYQTALPLIASGAIGAPGTPTWVAQAVRGNGNHIPPTASHVHASLLANSAANLVAIVAPSASYGASSQATNPPPVVLWSSTNFVPGAIQFSMQLESNNIYMATTAAGFYLSTVGWRDNL
jgi:hypothetical protein